ncbi:MAG TPA: lactate racemase domain-containing protein [Candidatus Angelobacter sp.]|nr:lactate racemase domain-containing protein [Candidatus Angelobacter sp.]
MTTERQLRTDAWHADSPLCLGFPPGWKVTVHWPNTPPRLSDEQVVEIVRKPIGQPSIRELVKGKSRPLILVDDVNRPTPAARVLSPVLQEFEAAGIPPSQVTILVARGSHGEPHPESMLLKVGQEAASGCRVLLHDLYRHTTRVGKTSFGTPVHVNREVAAADFVIGIGGVYPNNTAGFGGGAKLALGALDIRVISQLHRKHKGVGWGTQGARNTFREDIEEIARMIRLETVITAHVDADRELVRLRCGDYRLYYNEEVAFARQAFRAPKPGPADVVISNAFPNDLSLTFVHMKGIYPLRSTAPGASRIVLGACREGEGFHGVYPIVRMPLFHEQRDRLRRISLMTPGEMAKKIIGKVSGKFHSNGEATGPAVPPSRPAAPPQPQPEAAQPRNPIWLYRTVNHSEALPSPVRGIRTVSDWNQILETIRKEQSGRDDLNVVVYPCAPLQVLE